MEIGWFGYDDYKYYVKNYYTFISVSETVFEESYGRFSNV